MGRAVQKPKVPRSALAGLRRYWGDVPVEFFEAAVDDMTSLGYASCSWDGQNIGFVKDVSDDVRVVAFVRSNVPHCESNVGSCDISVFLMSRLLAQRSSPEDPWIPGPGAKIAEYMQGRVVFHGAQLSHLVWAEAERPSPQAWVPTAAGLAEMMSTYKRLVVDALPPLDSPAGLAEFIDDWANYRQPSWVTAKRPLKPGSRFAARFLDLIRLH